MRREAHSRRMTKTGRADLITEAERYLAAVAVFRAEGCEPHWRLEQGARARRRKPHWTELGLLEPTPRRST